MEIIASKKKQNILIYKIYKEGTHYQIKININFYKLNL